MNRVKHCFVTRLGLLVCLLIGGIILGGCEGETSTDEYEQQVMQDRVERDMSMREEESVLPPGQRSAFRGLDFYEVDPAYRFVVSLERSAQPDTVMVAESTGGVRPQVLVGHVTIPFPHSEEQLVVFRGESETPRGRLWLAFSDSTNGQTTYKAGRYVDLESTEEDSVVVDFNRAYNPTCVYNPDYACPLPPSQNRIKAPVTAGEKMPLFKEGQPS